MLPIFEEKELLGKFRNNKLNFSLTCLKKIDSNFVYIEYNSIKKISSIITDDGKQMMCKPLTHDFNKIERIRKVERGRIRGEQWGLSMFHQSEYSHSYFLKLKYTGTSWQSSGWDIAFHCRGC